MSQAPQLVRDGNTVQIQNLFLNHSIICFPSANVYSITSKWQVDLRGWNHINLHARKYFLKL